MKRCGGKQEKQSDGVDRGKNRKKKKVKVGENNKEGNYYGKLKYI